jgi:DMSO/TMAO reductase YedYZ molybdopterin-dependent catalytic subunit
MTPPPEPPKPRLPPGQQLAAPGKWPLVGERSPGPGGAWRLAICGEVERPLEFDLAQLQALPQVRQTIDIHCVTRWSKLGMEFAGVSLDALLQRARPRPAAQYVSFVARSPRSHSTSLPLADAFRLETLVALEAKGQPLEEVHGGPLRVVVPGRYFYKSLKWVERIELLAADRLGYWESEAGYHNEADPWLEQRFLAASLTRQQMAEALAGRDFSGRELRGIDARGRDLTGLVARDALLRNADFRDCRLQHACFDGANLSNAHFERADLRGASFAAADVEGANFAGADLRGANFAGASLVGASFGGAEAQAQDAQLAAKIDRSTLFDAASLDQLVPVEAEFVAAEIAHQSKEG